MNSDNATRRFYESLWPHRASVLRLALILTADPTEADDLAQETFLKAFKAIHQFRDGSDAVAWLATILRHTRIDRLRSASASAATLSLDQLDIEPADQREATEEYSSPQEVLSAFSDQHMIDALQSLPEDIRWTLLLVDVQGMEQRDAAELLEVPVGTVKSRLHRGRAMLRQALMPLSARIRGGGARPT